MEEIILLELSKQIRDQGYDATPDLPNLMIRIGDKMRIELAPIPITSDIHKSVLPMAYRYLFRRWIFSTRNFG